MDISVIAAGKYRINNAYLYYSDRYCGNITIPEQSISDGATLAPDLISLAWFVHDRICDYPYFDDGRRINAWQAATILHDVLKSEKRYILAVVARFATFFFGCKKARLNGWI